MRSKVLEQLYLSQGSFREDLLAEDIGDLLDSHAITSLDVGCRTVPDRVISIEPFNLIAWS